VSRKTDWPAGHAGLIRPWSDPSSAYRTKVGLGNYGDGSINP